MDLLRKHQIIFLSISIIFIVSVMYIGINHLMNHSKRVENLKKQFYITEMKNTLRRVSNSAGSTYILFNEDMGATTYSLQAPPHFVDVASIGDSIIKKSNSYKLLLKTKSGKEYSYLCYE